MGSVINVLKREMGKTDPKMILIARVEAVEPSYVVLSTERGTKRIYTKVSYKVGDSVRIQGDVILGPIASANHLPIFNV